MALSGGFNVTRSFAFLGLAALAACSSIKVQTEYDKETDFRAYRTYAYIQKEAQPDEAPAARDPRIKEAVIKGVDGNLTAKGLTRAAEGQQPDLLVAVYGFANTRLEVQSYGYHYAGVSRYGYAPVMNTGSADIRQYKDGTLIIDLVDAAKKELVWRGTATDTFQPGAEAKAITGAIDKTFEEYPPPAPAGK